MKHCGQTVRAVALGIGLTLLGCSAGDGETLDASALPIGAAVTDLTEPPSQSDSGCCRTDEVTSGSSGCADPDVADCVCRMWPECCAGAWGPQCVLEAALGCGACDELDPAIIALLSDDRDDDGRTDGEELVAGDDPLDPADGTSDVELAQFFGRCAATPSAAFPTASYDCSGPDEDGWTNLYTRDDTLPCPPPPPGHCTQAVIGRLADTARYIGCPGYTVLNRSDWRIQLNDEFIGCIASCELDACGVPAIVVSQRADIPDFSLDIATTSVTSRELCQFYNAGCTVEFADDNGPGYVDCACWSR